MPPSVTQKSAAGNTSNIAVYTTASITANNGDILVVCWSQGATTGTASVPNITATGLTFTNVVNSSITVANASGMARAVVSSAFSDIITITFTNAGTGAAWHVFTIQGADTTTPFNTSNTQNNNSGVAATSGTLTLPSTPAASSIVVGALVHGANEAKTAGTGFTVVGGAGTFGGYATPTNAIAAQSGVNGTTFSMSWTTSAVWRGICAEVNGAAVVGGKHPHPFVRGQALHRSTRWHHKNEELWNPETLLEAA